MKVYRILLTTMQGKTVYSDPMNVGELEHDEVVETLDNIIDAVGSGGFLQINVGGTRRTFLSHGIESIWWTEGS